MITIKNLHKFYNKGKNNEIHVINDVNLEFAERGMTAIFGRSGCGKTTLLNAIGGLDSFASGSLLIDGNDIRNNTDRIRNEYIGYIFQNYNLNPTESCFDNIADALRLCGVTDSAEIERRVNAALKNVGMEKYKKRTPDTLSGGQQQRIAIARAIVKNPRVILADEPTGNLDEANTVMIMDLLKAISEDHLVIIVTHEENLVNYYCDTVIELSDGRVENIRRNDSVGGFFARDKNDIYLGEFERSESRSDSAVIEYYGEKPENPIKIRIVNNGGRIYLELGGENVQIIDSTSEIRLKDGVYKEKEKKNTASENVDMSSLPPVKAKKCGKLFNFKSSLISALKVNFAKKKKGKVLLVLCMCLFSFVFVSMSAVFGTAFRDILNASDSYNHNVFYVYTSDGDVSAKLLSGLSSDSTGIDFIRLTAKNMSGDTVLLFRTGSFESFDLYLSEPFSTNAVILDTTLIKDKTAIEGRAEILSEEEIIISTKVADALLEKSNLGYIKERKDLIGLVSENLLLDGKSARIVGIVESSESAVYLSPISLAKYSNRFTNNTLTALSSKYGIPLSEGETVLAIRRVSSEVEYPSLLEEIEIQGRTLTVKEIKTFCPDYRSYLAEKGINKLSDVDYFYKKISNTYPDIAFESDLFFEKLNEMMTEEYYEYYDYFYSSFDEFFTDYSFFENGSFEVWLYKEKGIEDVKYLFAKDEYYRLMKFREKYERNPTLQELNESDIESIHVAFSEIYETYEKDFYNKNNIDTQSSSILTSTYLVSDEDYIGFSKALGKTHPTAQTVTESYEYYPIEPSYGYETYVPEKEGVPDYYTVVHSSDPSVTEEWLKREFPALEPPSKYYEAIITPNMLFDKTIEKNVSTLVANLITMGVLLLVMSVCMYFIMRSSLMSRIKEVGIYRAIGVSRKNIVFKFMIEAAVLTTLTVFVGYAISSLVLYAILGISEIFSYAIYYPMWLALVVLAILYSMSIFFGILPVLFLTRKTPSAILSKYDI